MTGGQKPGRSREGRDLVLRFRFGTTIIHWRGPSPFFYAPVPPEQAEEIRQASRLVTYGWGMIPVEATIGAVVFTTSLFPKHEAYLLPLRDAVRKQLNVTVGDTIDVDLTIGPTKR